MTGRTLALKFYIRLDAEDSAELAKEYTDMADISHPNLLRCDFFDIYEGIPYVTMRYCCGGSLKSKLGRMNAEELYKVAKDICAGLAYLHGEGIVHQDIKPENILHDTEHDRYLLSDFGISSKSRTRLSKSINMNNMTLSLTETYAPPEKFSSNPTDRLPDVKGDIFSLGITIYELATGILPFDPPMSTGREMLYSNGKLKLDYSCIQEESLRKMIEKCLRYKKEERPTADSLMFSRISAGDQRTKKIVVSNSDKLSYSNKRKASPRNKPNSSKHRKPLLYLGIVLLFGVLAMILTRAIMNRNIYFSVDGVRYKMVYVKGGSFTMGSDEDYFRDNENEMPRHQVSLYDYYIGETEVTQALWESIMGDNPSKWKGATRPVEQVSWDDAQEFIKKLNKATGLKFRLPTEEEWEYAAIGGVHEGKHNYAIYNVAWNNENSGGETHPVGTKQTRDLGLCDMHGNVSEWCQNCWRSDYNKNTKENCKFRAFRGGSWADPGNRCYAQCRGGRIPTYRVSWIGLRLVLDKQ